MTNLQCCHLIVDTYNQTFMENFADSQCLNAMAHPRAGSEISPPSSILGAILDQSYTAAFQCQYSVKMDSLQDLEGPYQVHAEGNLSPQRAIAGSRGPIQGLSEALHK